MSLVIIGISVCYIFISNAITYTLYTIYIITNIKTISLNYFSNGNGHAICCRCRLLSRNTEMILLS